MLKTIFRFIMTASRKLVESIYEEAILLIPNQSLPKLDKDSTEDEADAVRFLMRMKTSIYESSSKSALTARQTVKGRCVTLLYQTVCLVLDVKMSRSKFNNCLVYTGDVIKLLSSMSKEKSHYIPVVEGVSRARGRLLARRRNLGNNQDQTDFVLRMNFMNTLHDLETSLASLKEMMLMSTLWQHCDLRARLRDSRGAEARLTSVPNLYDDTISLAESEESLSDTSLDLLDNNNVSDKDAKKPLL